MYKNKIGMIMMIIGNKEWVVNNMIIIFFVKSKGFLINIFSVIFNVFWIFVILFVMMVIKWLVFSLFLLLFERFLIFLKSDFWILVEKFIVVFVLRMV